MPDVNEEDPDLRWQMLQRKAHDEESGRPTPEDKAEAFLAMQLQGARRKQRDLEKGLTAEAGDGTVDWKAVAERRERELKKTEEARYQAERGLAELAQAIRLTREYVGEDALPATEGWSWYDALLQWAPGELGGDAPVATVNPATYPHPDGDRTVLGPEIFTDGTVICWKGRNYVPQEQVQALYGLRAVCAIHLRAMVELMEDKGIGLSDSALRLYLILTDELTLTMPALAERHPAVLPRLPEGME